MAAPLKALHAKLKHLAWQAKQVSLGDYQQRIDFMGEFAEAFNNMTEQLRNQRAALLEEIESGRRKTKAVEQSNSLLKAITSRISQWIIVVNAETLEWLYVNHQADKVLTDPVHESELRLWIERQLEALTEETQPFSTGLELQGDAATQYFSVGIYALNWYESNAFAFVFTEISFEKEQLHSLQYTAYTDMLTQLNSRHYGMMILNEWISEKMEFILCFVDIDNLKYVNDRYGHYEGDRYIIEVAKVLRAFSSEAVLCRLGGDEFLILARGWKINKACEQMEMLRGKLINQITDAGTLYDHSISYGVIEIGMDNILTATDLLSDADAQMYEYKREHKMGRNKYHT